jgi:hypothetical protein
VTEADDLEGIERERGVRVLGRSLASRIAHEHPTLVFTLAYLALTAVGLIYDLWFFFYFKINILDYSETSDFLLAAIRNPLVILLSMLPVGILLFGLQVREVVTRKSQRYEAYRKKYVNTMWNSRPVKIASGLFFVIIYATAFTQIYAKFSASRVKHGAGARISMTRNDGVTSGEKPILLGSTTKFFFLYYPTRRETEIVPVDNVSRLTIDSRMRNERERDSLEAAGAKP